jgi:hypothetical protein
VTREIPSSKTRTVYRADGRWFLRRGAAYYAIAKRRTIARFPRWLLGHDVFDLIDGSVQRCIGDLYAADDGIEHWRDRRRRADELFVTHVPDSYDEPGHDYFDPAKWQRFVRRVARFMMFVDDRRAELQKIEVQ